ncbi:DUF396-domain-containing protein, partial [Lactarius akahatsu]
MSFLHLLRCVVPTLVCVAVDCICHATASGLLWLSELIEEHSKLAKVLGKRGIYVIISIHVLLAFTDALPLHKIAFSILCHFVYLQNFSHTWPVISLTSPSFVASCVLARQAAHKAYRGGPVVRPPSFGDMATFFGLCVWLTPLFLFLSLSANDNTLPTSVAQRSPPARSSLFRLMFGFLPGLRRASSRTAEGLIAPPSPGIPPPSPSHHSFPPRTPTRAMSHGEVHELSSAGLTPDFSLNRPPPKRTG